MLKLGDDPGFLLEAAGEFRVVGVLPGKYLEGDEALYPRLEGLEHRRHAALPKRRMDLVLAEGLTGEVFHCRSGGGLQDPPLLEESLQPSEDQVDVVFGDPGSHVPDPKDSLRQSLT